MTPPGPRGKNVDLSVKHLFDRIGEEVYNRFHTAALERSGSALQGILSEAIFEREKIHVTDPCNLNHTVHTNVTSGQNNENPCHGRQSVRFSDTQGAECYRTRIKGSEKNSGACAPFRKLHMCDRNLEHIEPHQITSTHNLLVDVLLAAKHEGESIQTEFKKNKHNYKSGLCTVLARSFADIGDIIRGKDLFLGHEQRKKKLEENLKNLFKNLYKELTKDNKNPAIKTHYEKDDPHFYQLREDWWNANRKKVWDAITCGVIRGTYFRDACSGGTNPTQGKCHCIDETVPTYFDYVPQYLRWFEEWAEDFCRKRKKKLEDAIEKCRKTESGEPKYCDLNGYDCTKTARGKEKYKYEHDCIECYSSCTPFTYWIDNQKQEFEKQKNKYADEIKKANGTSKGTTTTTIRTQYGTINNLYVGDFYEKLEEQYKSVQRFLELLNKETTCKGHPEVGEKKKTFIDFTDEPDDIFSHTEYCQACPLCGLKLMRPPWTPEDEKECRDYKIKAVDDSNSTEINLLIKDKKGKTMVQKLKSLCGNGVNKNNIQEKTWKCYYDKSRDEYDDGGDKDYCVLQNGKENTKNQEIESFNSLFWRWVTEMLKDSIDWRKEHENCINNNNTCKKGCKSKCECFQKWVERKTKEWEQVIEHYEKEDFQGFPRYWAIGYLLNEYFPKINAPYKGVKSVQEFIKEMKKIIEDNSDKKEATRHDNSINKVLDHEKEEAEKCIKKHNDCPQPPKPSPGHSESDTQRDTPSHEHSSEDDKNVEEEEEEEEEDDDEEDKDNQDDEEEENTKQVEGEGTTQEPGPPSPATPTVDNVKPCDIVSNLFSNTKNFEDACDLKYVTGKNYGWRCVAPSGTTSGDKAATGSEGSEGSGEAKSRERRDAASAVTTAPPSNSGATCIPPRRRKLYLGGFDKFISGEPEGSTPATSSPSPKGDALLLTAFVESAAIETFFLWHRYKKEWKAQKLAEQGQNGLLLGTGGTLENSDDPSSPQTQLQESGTIPTDFLRQMFYTLGDYRDIFEGKNMEVVNLLKDGSPSDKEMYTRENKINQAIYNHFSKNENQATTGVNQSSSGGVPSSSGHSSSSTVPPPVPQIQPSEKDPKTWWSRIAPSIWKGMVCALTYKESGQKPTEGTNKIEKDSDVYKKFFGDENNNGNPGTNTGTYQEKYEYKTVELKEENSGNDGAKQTQTKASPTSDTPLTQFVERPPYFRYLEEWGETFCRERAKRLAQIKYECRGDRGGHEYCSGDGHYCKTSDLKHNNMLADLYCPDCYKQCRKYRKWIGIKFEEFRKQENNYKGEHDKLTKDKSGGGDNNCCKEIEHHSSAADFLKELKHCKDGQGGGEKNKTDFENPLKTFGPLDYCKTCPLNGVNCNGGGRRSGGRNGCTPVKGNEWKSVFDKIRKNNENSTDITVQLIDRRGAFIEKYSKDLENSEESNNSLFKDSYLFKSVRDQNWECKFENENKDVCKLKNFKDKIDLNEYTTFKVLLVYWLQDFIEGYYILKKKKKIDLCTQKEGKTCSEEPKNDCVCVKAWVDQKKKEWKQIQEHFKNREQEDIDNNMKSSVRQLLEYLQYRTELNKIMKPCDGLDNFKASLKCNSITSSENSKEKDIVECMLEDRDKRIKTESCPDQTSGNQQQPCQESTPPVGDDDDPLEEEENTVEQPNICPAQTPEPEEKGDCNPAPPQPATPSSGEEGNPEQTPGSKPEEEAPARDVAPPAAKEEKPPSRQPQNPWEHPAVIPSLVTSTLAWSVGIGFAAFTYFYLKVLYIYIYIYIYMCGCICICGVCLDIYLCICMCFIYIFYIYVFILKKIRMKKMKKRKKKYKKKKNKKKNY